jgi:hypothetical protein
MFWSLLTACKHPHKKAATMIYLSGMQRFAPNLHGDAPAENPEGLSNNGDLTFPHSSIVNKYKVFDLFP